MSSDAHMLIKKVKGKEILEYGWSNIEIVARDSIYCLTKPWHSGSLTFGQSNSWTIFNLETKDEIAQFTKKKDAAEYFSYIVNKRQ